MYIRFIAKYFNHTNGREETGIFRAADYVRDHTEIGAAEKKALQSLIAWFDENLPVPAFYDDPSKRAEELHTYFWFKTSAAEFLERMQALASILEAHHVKVERLHAEIVPGEMIFEDHCQIAVAVSEDVLRIK